MGKCLIIERTLQTDHACPRKSTWKAETGLFKPCVWKPPRRDGHPEAPGRPPLQPTQSGCPELGLHVQRPRRPPNGQPLSPAASSRLLRPLQALPCSESLLSLFPFLAPSGQPATQTPSTLLARPSLTHLCGTELSRVASVYFGATGRKGGSGPGLGRRPSAGPAEQDSLGKTTSWPLKEPHGADGTTGAAQPSCSHLQRTARGVSKALQAQHQAWHHTDWSLGKHPTQEEGRGWP